MGFSSVTVGLTVDRSSIVCFSVQVDKDLQKIAKRFNAAPSDQAFGKFKKLQKLEKEKGPEFLKAEMGLKRQPSTTVFREADDQGRIYPGYWANLIVREKNQRVIKPMRYRVRPQGSREEVPSKYNLFNCRLDSIEKRKTWKSLFMKNHALFPFIKFYEWVERGGKKNLIHFAPDKREIIWAPALYDTWTSPSGEIEFDSFALITDDPPIEVAQAGHDRCPLFIKEAEIDNWLQPKEKVPNDFYKSLKNKETVYFLMGE